MRRIEAAKEIIKRFEGLRLKAYKCPAGVPTIGYGHTEGVKMGHAITSHHADVILDSDLDELTEDLEALLKGVDLNDNEFAALVSFAYNVGVGGLANSTLLKLLRKGDKAGAADQFPRWVRGGGKVLPGLVTRREAERALFLSAS